MCYPKPGPRCSAHAKASLKRAIKTFNKDQTDENYAAYQDAKADFYATPAGFAELEKEYKKTKDPKVLEYLQDRQAHRDRALRAIGVKEEEGRPVFHPAQLSEQALSSSLEWDGEKPKWWREYAEKAQNNDNPALSTAPELLDVIDSPLGKIAVIWEPISQSKVDVFPQDSKGLRVSVCKFTSVETGKDIGYIKATYATDESIENAYGNDEFTPFRMRRERHGISSYGKFEYYEEDEGRTPSSPEDLRQRRRMIWLAAQQDLGIGLETESGYVASYNLDESHIPDDATVQKDLKRFRKQVKESSEQYKKEYEVPFVDFARMDGAAKGQGFGAAAYVYTSRRLAKQGQALRSSGLQSEDAEKAWERMKRNYPDNVVILSETNSEGQPYALLDFRSPSMAV